MLLVLFDHDFTEVLSFETQELVDFFGRSDFFRDFLGSKCVDEADHNCWTEDKNSKVVDLPLYRHVETGHFDGADLVLLERSH